MRTYVSVPGINSLWVKATAAATASALTTTVCYRSHCLDKQDGDSTEASCGPLLSTQFMDKLAQKPYLQVPGWDRPPGVPRTLRLLTIDMPAVRTATTGSCDRLLGHIFDNGVAPPSRCVVNSRDRGSRKSSLGDETRMLVEQRVWIKAFYQCRQQSEQGGGVEIMEAHTAALNPRNLRRMRSFGSLQYDPGKYTSSPKKSTEDKQAAVVPSAQEEESTAPWNQHAWKEELELRVSGKVAFGEPLQRASRWMRWLYGYQYRRTVSRSSWFDPDGLDGSCIDSDGKSNWASNKPHAVVANGASLQRVPNAMRFLQKTCKDHNVPLFILHDPRKWGGNTHETLEEALEDMKRTVKKNIVTSTMQYAAGRPFRLGRMLGKLETEAKWQTREAARKMRQGAISMQEIRNERLARDWSQLDAHSLLNKLEDHGVATASTSQEGHRSFSAGFLMLVRQYLNLSATGIKDTDGVETHAEVDDTFEEVMEVETGDPL